MTTDTELRLMANAAIIGESNIPNIGNSTPAAIGTPMLLYNSANIRFCRMLFTVCSDTMRA